MNNFRHTLTGMALFGFTLGSAWAGADHHDHNNAKAHVHGHAALTIAIEHHLVEIQLTSPSVNIVGFEHTASSEAEWKAIKTAYELLNSTGTLFEIKGTRCSPASTNIDMSAITSQEHHEHKAHSDINAFYRLNCDDTAAIKSINVNLSKYFTGMESINTQWVTKNHQGSASLTPEDGHIDLYSSE